VQLSPIFRPEDWCRGAVLDNHICKLGTRYREHDGNLRIRAFSKSIRKDEVGGGEVFIQATVKGKSNLLVSAHILTDANVPRHLLLSS
jgi:hypothetical protein